MNGYDSWDSLYAKLTICQDCPLHKNRTHVVPGEGDPEAAVLFVGEGPGREEDQSGRPFVGRSSHMLDMMLASIQLDRKKVYIANVVKCRTPESRMPMPEEAEPCLTNLRAQIQLIQPKIIVCLGATATKYLFDPGATVNRERGMWKYADGVWMLATYHPAALLRNQARKEAAWEDMKKLQEKIHELGLYS